MRRKDEIILIFVLVFLLVLAIFRAHYWEKTRQLEPGSIVPEQTFNWVKMDRFFQIYDIPDTIFSLMQGRSYKENCTIPRSDLKYLVFVHRDLDGNAVVGEMVVNQLIATDILEIMEQLFLASYPIEKARLIDYYDADDETSMRDNNSSGFNWRFIKGTTTLSNHSTGLAVDINPLYNPYYKSTKRREIIQPQTGQPYLDRTADFPFKITEEDLCHALFAAHGFTWGGSWESPKDYQHFEKIEQ